MLFVKTKALALATFIYFERPHSYPDDIVKTLVTAQFRTSGQAIFRGPFTFNGNYLARTCSKGLFRGCLFDVVTLTPLESLSRIE